MSKITVFRGHALFLYFEVWRIYANKELVGKIRNCKETTFFLPSGDYDIMVNCAQVIFFNRKRGLYSNVIHIQLENDREYRLEVCPHPLIFWGRHHPSNIRIFHPVKCLLLMENNEHFQEKWSQFEQIKQEIRGEMQKFTYHPVSFILIIIFSLFAIGSNIWSPYLYNASDGLPWGFMFGVMLLFGLFNKKANKQMMARGGEFQTLLIASLYFLLLLFLMPVGLYWQKNVAFLFILLGCFWGFNRYRHWKKDKKGLDAIEQLEVSFENRI